MKAFYAKLLPPRPDFAQTLSMTEVLRMQDHRAYLRTFIEKGWIVAFGPVGDPAGFFGISIWEVPDDVDVAAICAADPAIEAKVGVRYEIHPMPSLETRK